MMEFFFGKFISEEVPYVTDNTQSAWRPTKINSFDGPLP